MVLPDERGFFKGVSPLRGVAEGDRSSKTQENSESMQTEIK